MIDIESVQRAFIFRHLPTMPEELRDFYLTREWLVDMAQGEEFLIGEIPHVINPGTKGMPSSDGYDYHPGMATPSWAELLDTLQEEQILGDFVLVFVGKIYADSDAIRGTAYLTNWQSCLRATHARGQEVPGETIDDAIERRAVRNPSNTGLYLQRLFELNGIPSHVTGIVIKEKPHV